MAARELNEVFAEWWRRLGDPHLALAEFHRALREGELIAWLYHDGKELRAIELSYWRRARLQFDPEDPFIVVPMLGDAPQRERFYVSPASPARSKHGGGRKRLLSSSAIKQTKAHYNKLLDEDEHRWRPQEAAARHLAVVVLKLPEESWQTVEDQIVIPVLKQRGLNKRRRRKK